MPLAKTLESKRDSPPRNHDQAQEGMSQRWLPVARSNTPGRTKPTRGAVIDPFSYGPIDKNVDRVPSPEVEASANHKRVAASARVYDSADGKRP